MWSFHMHLNGIHEHILYMYIYHIGAPAACLFTYPVADAPGVFIPTETTGVYTTASHITATNTNYNYKDLVQFFHTITTINSGCYLYVYLQNWNCFLYYFVETRKSCETMFLFRLEEEERQYLQN